MTTCVYSLIFLETHSGNCELYVTISSMEDVDSVSLQMSSLDKQEGKLDNLGVGYFDVQLPEIF